MLLFPFVGRCSSNTECSGLVALAFGLKLDRGIGDVICLTAYLGVYILCLGSIMCREAAGLTPPEQSCQIARGYEHLPDSVILRNLDGCLRLTYCRQSDENETAVVGVECPSFAVPELEAFPAPSPHTDTCSSSRQLELQLSITVPPGLVPYRRAPVRTELSAAAHYSLLPL